MAQDPIRYLTENPYIVRSTLLAGDEVANPANSDRTIYMLETAVVPVLTGAGRMTRKQAVLVGDIKLPGMALSTTVAATNWGAIRIGWEPSIYAFVVAGRAAGGDAAIIPGDTVFADAADTQLNNDVTNGSPFGMALGNVATGNTTTVIPVLVFPFGLLIQA